MNTKPMAHNFRTRTSMLTLLVFLVSLLFPATTFATPPIEGNTVEFGDSGQALGGAKSNAVAIGDLDGDGDLDAFVANFGEANRVWTNDGGALSVTNQSLGSAFSADVALGDLDGDGDLDAFVANNGQANTVWVNSGSGAFSNSGQTLGGSDSTSVTLGDVDGDGDLDAVVTNFYNGSRVWINSGGAQGGTAGVFGSSVGLGESGLSYGVALGDVDGDGDLDAFVANAGEGVGAPNRVWLNDGGSFSNNGQDLGNGFSRDVSLGDVDGDGDLDAVVANFNQANTVWINNGGAQGGTPGLFSDSGQSLAGARSFGVALGDVDNDGDLDAFVANVGQANRVWVNNGGGSFSNGQTLGNRQSRDVALGDLDGDGDLDAVVANYDQANMVWTNNAVHRNAPFADSGQNLGSSNSQDVVLGDLDNDGDLDAVVANCCGQANKVWMNNSGNFTDSSQNLGEESSYGVALGDVDSDGDLDVIFANSGAGNSIWLNDGDGNFTDSGQSLGNSNSLGVALGDVDGDGDLDAFFANDGQANRVWVNNGGAQGGTIGVFSNSGQALGNAAGLAVALGDVDGDGDLDAVVINRNQANKVWVNNGGAQNGPIGVFSNSGQNLGSANSSGVALGDVEGDGDLDVFIARFEGANKIWINNGSGGFSDSAQNLGNADSTGVAFGDVDGDGDLDAFVANYFGANKIWVNSGGSFSNSRQNLGNSDSYDVALGDVDGDGDLDAFVVNDGRANKVWRNEGGSAGFIVSDTSPDGAIPNNSEDDLLKVIFSHNGIAADHDLELNFLNLALLRDDCTTPLTSAEANAIIENLRLRLDDGDGLFETDGSDTLVTGGDIADLSLTDGVQTMTFTNDDTDVQVDQDTTPTRTYWISVLTTGDADQQNPNAFCLRFDPDADLLAEGKSPDFSVSIADTEPTAVSVGSGPLAVTLGWFLAERNGDAVDFRWQTATESGTAGFHVLAESDGARVQLNGDLIPSPVIDAVTPVNYAFTAVTEATRFYLEEVGVDGGMTAHGPYDLGQESGSYAFPDTTTVRPASWLPLILRGAPTPAATSAVFVDRLTHPLRAPEWEE